jgi:hypothetical protein
MKAQPPAIHLILRRCVLCILVWVLGMPLVALGQNSRTSWESLNEIHAGEKIRIILTNSKKVDGTFVNVTDAAISLQGSGSEQVFQRLEVRGVKLMENRHRLRHAAIGAAIGAGVGAGAGAGVYAGCKSFCFTGTGAGIGAAAGGVIGAIVGALWPSRETVYQSGTK